MTCSNLHRQDIDRAQGLFEASSGLLTRIRYMLAIPWPVRWPAHIARLRGDAERAPGGTGRWMTLSRPRWRSVRLPDAW